MNIPKELLHPLLAQVALTALIWATLLTARLVSMLRNGVGMEELKGEEGYRKLADTDAISDNFENQFEVPILFYLVLVLLMISGKNDSGIVTASWIFVGTRVAHALVHCTFNSVYVRFATFFAGCVTLAWMWWHSASLWMQG
jgi:hypothetical protein